MKIALCFSGLIRPETFQKSYENVFNSIIKTHNPDIFVHSWLDDGLEAKELVLSTLKPKKFKIDEYSEKFREGYNFNSMFKSIYESNELKKQYEIENDLKYDVVIRYRYDIMIENIVDFTCYDMTKLNIKIGYIDKLKVFNDIFAFSNSLNMDIFCDVYNNIDNILNNKIKNNERIYAEKLLTYYLNEKEIQTNSLNLWFGLTRHIKN
jgi:hypothetical protein